MCHIAASELESFQPSSYYTAPQLSKTAKIYVVRLRRNGGRVLSHEAKERAKLEKLKKAIKMKNLKLYKENKTIIEENERLRKKALLLHQENKALLQQLQQNFQPLI